jgi:retron-type reverse transcriptase
VENDGNSSAKEDLISEFFNRSNLIRLTYDKVASKKRCATGIDYTDSCSFIKNLTDELQIITKKVENGSYKFTRYRMMLIPKGPGKPPRKICVPTIRDRVVIAGISQILKKKFPSLKSRPRPDQVIKQILTEKDRYSGYIKLDLTRFFASISFKLLMNKLQIIGNETVLNLIEKIITTSAYDPETGAVYDPGKNQDPQNNIVGVPEGLSCSGLLADIFLEDIDEKYGKLKDICYFRFVDDILILYNGDREKGEKLKNMIIDDLRSKKLQINENKTEHKSFSDGLFYLGYYFRNDLISVREESIRKHEKAIESMVKKYANKITSEKSVCSVACAKFELDNKISMLCTGMKVEDEFMGWLSYYRYINDTKLLHHFDWLVKSLYKRYNIPEYRGKRHVRAYYELNRNIKNTKYIFRYLNLKSHLENKRENFIKYYEKSTETESQNESVQATDTSAVQKAKTYSGIIKSASIGILKRREHSRLSDDENKTLSMILSLFNGNVEVNTYGKFVATTAEFEEFLDLLKTSYKKEWKNSTEEELKKLLKTKSEDLKTSPDSAPDTKVTSENIQKEEGSEDHDMKDHETACSSDNQKEKITAPADDQKSDENSDIPADDKKEAENKIKDELKKLNLDKYIEITENVKNTGTIYIDDYAFLKGLDKSGNADKSVIADEIIGELMSDPIIEEDLRPSDYR